MTNTLAEDVGRLLPPPVTEVQTDPTGIRVAGARWTLWVSTTWRLRAATGLERLVGDAVIAVEFPAGPAGLDVRLITRNGAVLDVHSEPGDYDAWL